MVQQWTQAYLLGQTNAERVLEVGPAGGFVTAMLLNIGYDVPIFDLKKFFEFPDVPAIEGNMLEIDAGAIHGFDAIICCEMLEHVPYEMTDDILQKYHDSEARYLIVSVPYMAFQITFSMYLNAHTFRQYFSMKKFLSFKQFKREPEFGHQWEIGYRGHSLEDWERKLTSRGYKVLRREFTEDCRSVFHLLERLP